MAVVLAERDGGILTVTLADEENRNALSGRLVGELTDVLDDADADPEVRVVVLTNSGRVFCAGADLSERSSDSGGGGRRDADPARLFSRFAESPKVYVGRIAGHCVAGGMGLAAAMDLSVAVEDARFGFTEARIGVAPSMISVLCLPRMRHADASAAFLRGNRFLAPEAARLGIVNEAVPADELDATVAATVADVLACGPEALAACKQLLARVPGMPRDEAFAWTSELSSSLFRGDEAKAGMRAYLEKRPPPWAPGASQDDEAEGLDT